MRNLGEISAPSLPRDPALLPPLTVCVVLPSATRGGAELWQERVVGDRVSLDVVALADGPAAQAWRDRRVATRVIPAGRRHRGAGRAVNALADHLRRTRPDLVVGHGVKAGAVAAAAGHLAGVRTVWVRHDDSFPGWPVRLLDRLTDGQLATSPSLIVNRPHCGLLRPPLAGPPLDRAAARGDLHLPERPVPTLVMACRLTPDKGIDDAIAAIARVHGWELVVHGIPDAAHPDERERLTTLARVRGVSSRVHLREPVEDLGRRLAAYDALAVLTRPDDTALISSESFGMSALEAAAAGIPVIAVPPVSDHLGASALAVDPGDVTAVAAALDTLRAPESREDFVALGERISDDARYDRARAADSFATYLAHIASRPGAGRVGREPISVVTTVLDEEATITPLLEAIETQLGEDDELIVVDAGSLDDTLAIVGHHALLDPRIRLLHLDGAGISEGRNHGIAAARHDLIACTDAGCHPHPGWLSALRAAAADQPHTALFTGLYNVPGRSPWQRAWSVTGYPVGDELRHPTPLTRGYGRAFGRAFDATMPTGRSVAFRRFAWREVGGFPEHLATGEDVTFGRAIARQHEAVLVADAEVTWFQRETLRDSLRMYFRYGEGSANSLDARLLFRDGLRLVGYLGGAAALWHGGVARPVALVAAAVYLSLPVRRALSQRQAALVVPLVPVVTVLRDGAKVAGAVSAGIRRLREARVQRPAHQPSRGPASRAPAVRAPAVRAWPPRAWRSLARGHGG